MFKKIKESLSLISVLKIIGMLIVILFLVGMGIGFFNVFQAKQERNDIKTISTLLDDQGLTDVVKQSIQKFINKYSRIKNIIICDKNASIVYKANDQLVEGKDKFELNPDDELPGVNKMKEKPIWFMKLPKNSEFFPIGPNRMEFAKGDKPIPMGDYYKFKDFGAKVIGNKGNVLFIRSFEVSSKGLTIFFISGRFEENNLMEVQFISYLILRLMILVFWVLLAAWVYRDSMNRGLHQVFWGLFTLLTGFIGLIVYLIVKHKMKFCRVCTIKVDKGTNYCHECGSALKIKCPSCEEMMDVDLNYCTNCGRKNVETEE